MCKHQLASGSSTGDLFNPVSFGSWITEAEVTYSVVITAYAAFEKKTLM